MKKIIIAFLMVSFSIGLIQPADARKVSDQTQCRNADILGDDLFPWPWGTECPFPWRDIEGTWRVVGPKGAYFNGHILTFNVQYEGRNSVKFLEIEQYSSAGVLFAGGHGYSEKDRRIVKGILTTDINNKNYVVMVRSYARDQKTCQSSDLVTAVTFCPVRGKKCMEDSNYILERFEQPN